MNKLHLLLSFFLILISLKATAIRALYVDNFATILGDIAAENVLLNYAQNNDIETLLLYELHIVHANIDMTNPATNTVLADFISKAKTSYGILYVGGSGENSDFLTNVVDAYTNSRSNPLEKFDIYNLEFEYWQTSSTGPGGYYCTTYLSPNGYPCTVNGAFQFYVSILQTMTNLANNNSHPITTEAYVGWPTAAEASTIGANLDRVRVHAYVVDPNTSFTYTRDRLIDFANGNPGLNISILFSSEPNFMQTWLENNSMIAAETIFTDDWLNDSAGWANNFTLEGFTYFTYTYMENIILPVELSYFKGELIDQSIHLNWETLSEINSAYFEVEWRNSKTNKFNAIGQVKAAGNSTSAIPYQFIDKNPNVGINYYRLKQIDSDGKFKYSNTVAHAYQDKHKRIKIYPSLAQDIISVTFTEKIEQIFIYDTNGRKVKEVNDFDTLTTSLNISDLMSGVYLLVLKSELGLEPFRFVKQK